MGSQVLSHILVANVLTIFHYPDYYHYHGDTVLRNPMAPYSPMSFPPFYYEVNAVGRVPRIYKYLFCAGLSAISHSTSLISFSQSAASMSEPNERPPSPIQVPWPFRPPHQLEPSHPLYNHVTRDHEQADVQSRWDAEWDEFDRCYRYTRSRHTRGPSGLNTILWLRLCLHRPINASMTDI